MDKRKKRFWIVTGLTALGITLMVRKFKLLAPVKGTVTGKFGNRINPITKVADYHNGIDIKVPVGTVVKAPASGTVFNVYRNEAGGLQMILLHKNGFKTGYAHLDNTLVSKGDSVKTGQEIAKTGKSGRVTGAHLHWTVTDPKGVKVDPLKYLA